VLQNGASPVPFVTLRYPYEKQQSLDLSQRRLLECGPHQKHHLQPHPTLSLSTTSLVLIWHWCTCPQTYTMKHSRRSSTSAVSISTDIVQPVSALLRSMDDSSLAELPPAHRRLRYHIGGPASKAPGSSRLAKPRSPISRTLNAHFNTSFRLVCHQSHFSSRTQKYAKMSPRTISLLYPSQEAKLELIQKKIAAVLLICY
jgi:hypothetical protein